MRGTDTRKVKPQGRHDAHEHGAEREAERTARSRKQRAFYEELLNEPSARRAHGKANGELALSFGDAADQNIGNVQARDQDDADDGR